MKDAKKKPEKKPLPKYFQDRLIPPLDETKLSPEEFEEHQKLKKQAMEIKAWAKEQLRGWNLARNTPPSKNFRCKKRIKRKSS